MSLAGISLQAPVTLKRCFLSFGSTTTAGIHLPLYIINYPFNDGMMTLLVQTGSGSVLAGPCSRPFTESC
jgi:hypothetical protein